MILDSTNVRLKTPTKPDEFISLLREQPDGWEYLLYAGKLQVGMQNLEDEYRDHLIGYAPLTGEPLSAWASIERLKAAFPDALALVSPMHRLFAAETVQNAMGRLGEPGNADAIEHLADRTMAMYRSWMDWGKALRSARVPAEFQLAFHLAADFMRRPIEDMRVYVHKVVEFADSLERLMKEDEPVTVTLELVVSLDDAVEEEFSLELKRLEGLQLLAD